MNALPHSPVKVFVLRLRPHDDLKKSLQTFAADNNLAAAIVLTCTGSLRQYHLRFANQKTGGMRSGHFEIVSLTGTLSATSAHLHISVSDEAGHTTGGHLLNDNLIFTTAEIAIGILPDLAFHRSMDPDTGYPELEVKAAGDR